MSYSSNELDPSLSEQRFVAANMTQAMRKLTEALGAEAVLLSSRRVENGVEVIGLPPGATPSVDDFQQLHSERRRRDRRVQGRRASDRRAEAAAGDTDQLEKPGTASTDQQLHPERRQRDDEEIHSSGQLSERSSTDDLSGDSQRIDLRQTAADLARQIEALNRRQAMSIEESSVSLSEKGRQGATPVDATVQSAALSQSAISDIQLQPAEYVVGNRLRQLQLSESLLRQLIAASYHSDDEESRSVDGLWRRVLENLTERLVVANYDLAGAGGVYAFVGPPGVGKTAAIHKLLASLALQQQGEQLALVTFTGNESSPQQARLQRLAEVSGIEILPVDERFDLQQRIDQCATKRLVLIDASSPANAAPTQCYHEGIAQLHQRDSVREVVCLSATSEPGYQRDLLSRYRSTRSFASLLTHCDESHALGTLISLLIEQKMPLFGLSSGALLPQQFTQPDSEELVQTLVEGSDASLAALTREVMMPIVNLPVDEASASTL